MKQRQVQIENTTRAISGEVLVSVWDAHTGNLLKEFREHNLVVNLGKKNIAQLLGGAATGKKIAKVSVGTSGSTPAIGDVAITNSYVKTLDGTSYPSSNSVAFTWSLGDQDANGMNIVEFGLLNVDNVLCARKVRAEPIQKTENIIVTGFWKITIN